MTASMDWAVGLPDEDLLRQIKAEWDLHCTGFVLSVPCPKCGAGQGRPCRAATVVSPHHARVVRLNILTAERRQCPDCRLVLKTAMGYLRHRHHEVTRSWSWEQSAVPA